MEKSKACSEPFSTTRELVDFINDRHVRKEDIVEILNIHGQLFLIYFD